jgi:hypothetical protein
MHREFFTIKYNKVYKMHSAYCINITAFLSDGVFCLGGYITVQKLKIKAII